AGVPRDGRRRGQPDRAVERRAPPGAPRLRLPRGARPARRRRGRRADDLRRPDPAAGADRGRRPRDRAPSRRRSAADDRPGDRTPRIVTIVDVRTGIGWDSHRLTDEQPDRPLILGGITIDGPLALDGHSDADVLTHAVIDALLGAAGL